MKTTLSLSSPSSVETDCLAVVLLDRTEKAGEKADVAVASADNAAREAATDLIATGEASGKLFEATLIHRPAKLKAKRLLLLGGGKAADFTASELRKLAGAAVRFLKPRGIRSLAFVAPEGIAAEEAIKAIVEGAFVGNFDPDVYKSDRKDQQIESVMV